jgi:cation:H+ antiporter
MTLSIIDIVAIMGGFAGLIWTAERFVVGASAIANNLGVPPIIIGLTIVGFGTSAPEIFVSVIAALQGSPILGVGNALGSNIANIGLILGTTALVTPLVVRSETLSREFPMLMVVMLIAVGLVLDGKLSRVDGIFLQCMLVLLLYLLVRIALRSRKTDPMNVEFTEEIPKRMPMSLAFTWFSIGLVGLVLSSRILVWGSVNVATSLGVSELIIGLTVVAIGTSLPEMAASIVGALKKEHDLVIGNIVGSNMFNLLAVYGLPGVISPVDLPDELLVRDFGSMIGITVIFFVMVYGFRRRGGLKKAEGAGLLAMFIAYQSYLVFLSFP